MPPFANHARDLADLAAESSLQRGSQSTHNTQGIDAVANEQLARTEAFELETIHFIARQAGNDRAFGRRNRGRGNHWWHSIHFRRPNPFLLGNECQSRRGSEPGRALARRCTLVFTLASR